MKPEEIRAANLQRAIRLVLPELQKAINSLGDAAGELIPDIDEYDELQGPMGSLMSIMHDAEELQAEIKKNFNL